MMTAKLFENGRSQAVRLPKEYRFHGEEVSINKIGDVVILMPQENQWSGFLSGLSLFLSPITILEFGSHAAEEYGRVRAELEKKGTPIGPMDLLIAGHARAEGLILVTNNTKEFCRVENLDMEDWTFA